MKLSDAKFYRIVGRNIRRHREGAGWSQGELADAIGLTRTSVTNIEQGRQKMLLETFVAVCDVLDFGPEWFLPAPKPKRRRA